MTARSLLSLAAGVLPEFEPVEVIDAAAAAGFEAVGVWFDADTWTDARTRAVRERLDATGLHPLDMEPIFVTPDGDHGDRLIDAALAIGVDNILTVALGVGVDGFAERFGELCDRAAPGGITVTVEFGRIFGVASLPEALRVLALVDRPNAGVLLDNIHVDRAGHSNADVAAVDPSLISYAQVCDAPAAPADTSSKGLRTDAVDDRCNLDAGALPWRGFLAALPEGTPLSLEIRSSDLRQRFPDPAERARSVFETATRALEYP